MAKQQYPPITVNELIAKLQEAVTAHSGVGSYIVLVDDTSEQLLTFENRESNIGYTLTDERNALIVETVSHKPVVEMNTLVLFPAGK